jgi:hypothetical protein
LGDPVGSHHGEEPVVEVARTDRDRRIVRHTLLHVSHDPRAFRPGQPGGQGIVEETVRPL